MIETDRQGPIGILRLAHGKVNALDVEFANAISAAVQTAASDPAIRALVLTGNGAAFSAGVDLKRLVGEGADYADRLLDALDRAFDAVFCCPKPVVAALNGHALAGGFVLACACDYRIMATGKGRVGVPEIAAGVPFPWIALELVRLAVSPEHLPELVAIGATFPADQARERGLVQELTDPDHLLARALELAEQLAANAGPAFDLQRQQLRGPSLADPRRATHDAQVRDVWRAAATRERVQRYLEQLGRRG